MNQEWQRFETTRVYVHPPKAERLITLWREGKIMLGEMETPINKYFRDVSATGLWFTWGDHRQVDFHKTRFRVREDGIPVHVLTLPLGKLEAEIECVSDYVRCPTCFIRLSLKNPGSKTVRETVGYMLRHGRETDLIFSAPDVYDSYNPDIQVWKNHPSGWKYSEIWREGEYFVSCSDSDFLCDEQNGSASKEVMLGAGEETVIYFSFGKGEARAFDYETEKQKTLERWNEELLRINKLPESVLTDAAQTRMIRNLTVQMLQCFAYGEGTEDLYSRQGGLQRRIWTYEAMPVLEALTRIGDFDDYIEPVIDVYFRQFQRESGEMVPLGIHWAMATGTVIRSFAEYAMVRGKEYYLRYRDRAFRAFAWMRETRGKKKYDGQVAPEEQHKLEKTYPVMEGLFPPMSCCDDPLIFQAWLSTDCNNILGLRALTEAAELFDDPDAGEVRREYEAYLDVVRSVWEKIKEAAGDTDELEIPYAPMGNTEEIIRRYHFMPSMGFLLDALRPEPDDYNRIINFYTRRGFMRGGLMNKMPDRIPDDSSKTQYYMDENGKFLVWYVCAQEYGWFRCFLQYGDLERCREIVRDNIRFAMSDEYYMLERFHIRDPWYAPWSPNASCSGRLINMMLDLA